MNVRVVRTQASENDITDPDEIRPLVLEWREAVSNALGFNISSPLEWDESGAVPYFTDKPDWDGYWGVRLWASYAEHPEIRRPSDLPEEFEKDPAFVASRNEEFETRFPTLVRDIELWLPHDFEFSFHGGAPNGAEMEIGSSVELLRELEELNASTWKADESTVESWRREGPTKGSDLENAAKFGIAIFLTLTRQATKHRLPMLIDY